MNKVGNELLKSVVFEMNDIVNYLPNCILIRSILRSGSGYVSAVSFDQGEVLTSKISPFDTVIEIIDGSSEVVIDDVSFLLDKGQSIIIPAHARNIIRANIRFKMIATVIRSGYQDSLI